MAEHLSYHDERMVLTTDMAEPYFGSTYVDGVIDRHVKPFLNQVVRRSTRLNAQNHPNPKKIAVISDLWFPTHSVYRNYAAFVREMSKDFHLTFFHAFKAADELDVSGVPRSQRLEFRDRSAGHRAADEERFRGGLLPGCRHDVVEHHAGQLPNRADPDLQPRAFGEHVGLGDRLFHQRQPKSRLRIPPSETTPSG